MREYGILGRLWLLVSDSAQNIIKGQKSTYNVYKCIIFHLGAKEFDPASREAQEEEPCDDKWERRESDEVDEIEEEAAMADRRICFSCFLPSLQSMP